MTQSIKQSSHYFFAVHNTVSHIPKYLACTVNVAPFHHEFEITPLMRLCCGFYNGKYD